MNQSWAKIIVVLAGLTVVSSAQASVDSYRFMHVTIATPWYIFIFLLMGVFAPFVLMAVLAWSSAARSTEKDAEVSRNAPSGE
jgi:uncharacterized membrane protein YadS